jgi:hypothetical protein
LWTRWNYYSRQGQWDTINTAEVIVPEGIDGPVLLDATASQNVMLELFKGNVDIIGSNPDARSYSNVNLHVAYSGSVGKTKMTKYARQRSDRLMVELIERLSSDRKVFVCCHKDVEPHLAGFGNQWAAYDVGHYGALDGRNDWQEFDTAVIFGLSYRSRVWALNSYMAFNGVQTDHWLMEKANDIRKKLENAQIAVSVVQAINRVRCRRVIDSSGNCAPTDVYIVLPRDSTGAYLLKAIKKEMPGINVLDWDFVLEDKSTKRPRRSNHGEALIRYMETILPGEVSASTIKTKLGIPQRSWMRLVSQIKDLSNDITVRLTSMGVRLEQRGIGRGARTYLVKA